MMPTKAMLTRLYIDNYKCFSNFELKLGSLQLLLGDNGTGKSSVLDAVVGLQKLLRDRDSIAESGLGGTTLTRWDRRSRQTFELDAQPPGLPKLEYRIELEVSPSEAPPSLPTSRYRAEDSPSSVTMEIPRCCSRAMPNRSRSM